MIIKKNSCKTVGVSFSPSIKEAAQKRAQQLGLSFSKYTTLCIQSELKRANLETGPDLLALGNEPTGSLNKIEEITFGKDVFEILKLKGWKPVMKEKKGNGTDIDISLELRKKEEPMSIGILLKKSINKSCTEILGESIILKNRENFDKVIICVPYLSSVEKTIEGIFKKEAILITSVDSISKLIEAILKN